MDWQWLTHDAAGFFTAVLVIVGALQLVLFVWQLRLIRTSLDDAKIAADAGADAAKAASRQANVAEETLAKIERPYLFVYNVSAVKVVDETELHQDGAIFIEVTYCVGNHGKIPAIIKQVQAGFSVSTEPQVPPRLGYNENLVVSPILAAGEVRPDVEETLAWSDFATGEYQEQIPLFGDNELFFWVIISYRGPFSDGHETRACWRYDGETTRMIGPHGGDKYNGEK